MISTLRSLWTWIAIATLLVLWLPLLAVVRLFDDDPARYATGRWFRRVGVAMTRVNPFWDVHISGERVEDPRRPYVVVSNHQSQADIPIISRLPWEMKWVGKAELFQTPVVGWLMRMAGDIQVNRGDKMSRARVLVTARDYLNKRCSVMFFPEGTRSPDGRVHAFADGAFRLAIKAQVPVLPLALDGTLDALPKNSWRFQAGSPILLKVLPPIETAGMKPDDAGRLRDLVRERIVAQLAEWRGAPAGEIDALAEAPAALPDRSAAG